MIYYIKAIILVASGARYHRHAGLGLTLKVVAQRRCRLHWLRSSMLEA